MWNRWRLIRPASVRGVAFTFGLYSGCSRDAGPLSNTFSGLLDRDLPQKSLQYRTRWSTSVTRTDNWRALGGNKCGKSRLRTVYLYFGSSPPSGHKGKGYEVQVSETCEEGNAVQMITHVEVTPSSDGDAGVTVGVIDTLRERGTGPSELWCDTSYGSGHNGWEAERRGTELVSPVGGRAPGEADENDGLVRLTAADFDIDVTARRAAVCPAGHEAVSEYEDEEAPERVEMHFAREVCEPCSLRSRCPVRWRRRPELGGEWSPSGAYVLSADLARVNIGRRRRAESDGQWRKRYGLRAGIEGTNSELKRRHGLGHLRVRGGERVRLAVYLKALACNVKRMVRARLDEMLVPPAVLATAPPTA